MIFQTKTEMLDNLLEIEVAYSLLKGGDGGEDPIDAHYKKLKTEIVVIILLLLQDWDVRQFTRDRSSL